MKNIFLVFTTVAISSIFLVNRVAAQNTTPVLVEGFVTDLSRPIIISVLSEPKNSNSEDIGHRAVKDFQKRFKEVAHADWNKTFDGGYIACFEKDAAKTMVAYDDKGKWHHTIRRYSEKELPEDVRKMVKSIYHDYNIFSVAEVKMAKGIYHDYNISVANGSYEDQLVYFVYVQDETTYKTIRVSAYDMQEVQSIIKL